MVESSLRTMMIDSVPILNKKVVALVAHPVDVAGDEPLARRSTCSMSAAKTSSSQ